LQFSQPEFKELKSEYFIIKLSRSSGSFSLDTRSPIIWVHFNTRLQILISAQLLFAIFTMCKALRHAAGGLLSVHPCLSLQAPPVMAYPATTPTGMMGYGMVSTAAVTPAEVRHTVRI